jgi:hypothetical protein
MPVARATTLPLRSLDRVFLQAAIETVPVERRP